MPAFDKLLYDPYVFESSLVIVGLLCVVVSCLIGGG